MLDEYELLSVIHRTCFRHVRDDVFISVDSNLELPTVDYVEPVPLVPLLDHPLPRFHLRLSHYVYQNLVVCY